MAACVETPNPTSLEDILSLQTWEDVVREMTVCGSLVEDNHFTEKRFLEVKKLHEGRVIVIKIRRIYKLFKRLKHI